MAKTNAAAESPAGDEVPEGSFTVDEVLDESFRIIGEQTVTARLRSRRQAAAAASPPLRAVEDHPSEGG